MFIHETSGAHTERLVDRTIFRHCQLSAVIGLSAIGSMDSAERECDVAVCDDAKLRV